MGERTDWIPRVEHILQHGEAVVFPTFDREAMLTGPGGEGVDHLLDTFARLRGRALHGSMPSGSPTTTSRDEARIQSLAPSHSNNISRRGSLTISPTSLRLSGRWHISTATPSAHGEPTSRFSARAEDRLAACVRASLPSCLPASFLPYPPHPPSRFPAFPPSCLALPSGLAFLPSLPYPPHPPGFPACLPHRLHPEHLLRRSL